MEATRLPSTDTEADLTLWRTTSCRLEEKQVVEQGGDAFHGDLCTSIRVSKLAQTELKRGVAPEDLMTLAVTE
jgi:hypothetical protein